MTQVVLITQEQKDLLADKKFAHNSTFNPTQDADGNWFISIEERDTNIYKRYEWLNNCPLIDYNPVPFNFPI